MQQFEGRVSDVNRVRGGAVPYGTNPAGGQLEETREMRGFEATPLADMFFSRDNIDALHEGIRYRVFVESNGKYVISRQSEQELKIIMRSIFLQEARNEPHDVLSQVRELNGKVLAFCVPRIVNEIGIYKAFQRDVASLPTPMPRGEMATSKGTKVLNLVRF